MNTALEYSTRVVQEGGRRCKKSTLNDLVHLTPLRIPLINPPYICQPKEEKPKIPESVMDKSLCPTGGWLGAKYRDLHWFRDKRVGE
jgi:hypothetical protein